MEGIWVKGNQEGQGKYTDKNGVVKIGIWEGGVRKRWVKDENELQMQNNEVEKSLENQTEGKMFENSDGK